MPYKQFNRSKLIVKSLSERKNKVLIEKDFVPVTQLPENKTEYFSKTIDEVCKRIRKARKLKAPVILTFGAHTLMNGMGPTIIRLMEDGWLTHLATNGSGIIHDWEFSYFGYSSDDVKASVKRGEYGIWEETGKYINLALIVGAFEGKGYGESVGSMINNGGIEIPSKKVIDIILNSHGDVDYETMSSALDLLDVIDKFNLKPGWLGIKFPYKEYCVQAAAFRLGIPFTGHPMIGHDIIYTHPMNHGAALGRTALRDFLSFTESVNKLENGVYLSVDSAEMSSMIFEKSLSMSQNLQIQKGKHIDKHYMLIVDLIKSNWDWQKNVEPLPTDPEYSLRYLKAFSRMGGIMKYLCAENKDFLLGLYQNLSTGK